MLGSDHSDLNVAACLHAATKGVEVLYYRGSLFRRKSAEGGRRLGVLACVGIHHGLGAPATRGSSPSTPMQLGHTMTR